MGIVLTNTILVLGVALGNPFGMLGALGLSSTGPVAGGLFAVAQGSGIVAGTWMAAAQSMAMAPTVTGMVISSVGWIGTSLGVVGITGATMWKCFSKR
jgi:hypothetical protein